MTKKEIREFISKLSYKQMLEVNYIITTLIQTSIIEKQKEDLNKK